MNRMLRAARPAFTLVELLVVIGIIAVLMGILLPSLSAAQEQARQIKCASNLRNVGNGINIYLAGNKQIYPPAYMYVGQTIGSATADASRGYVHWSSYLYGAGVGGQGVGLDSFKCPSFENGGLPATNPGPGESDPGTEPDYAGVVDEQAPRMAYTVNEAIMPRNKFKAGFQGAVRPYRLVNAGMIRDSSNVILATEFNTGRPARLGRVPVGVRRAGRQEPPPGPRVLHRPQRRGGRPRPGQGPGPRTRSAGAAAGRCTPRSTSRS
jgi:prepilin-type N-terminal cleavage/methylation domain-containing protein